MSADTLQLIILPAGIIAVLFALYLARDVLSRDTGTKEMEDVAGTIFEGAVAFIRRQYTTIAALAVVGAVVIGVIISLVESSAQVAGTQIFGVDLPAGAEQFDVEVCDGRVRVSDVLHVHSRAAFSQGVRAASVASRTAACTACGSSARPGSSSSTRRAACTAPTNAPVSAAAVSSVSCSGKAAAR